jgi:hypothetical protein
LPGEGTGDKRLIFACAVLVLVVIVGCALPLFRPSPSPPPAAGFTEEMTERIRGGMTEAEVVAVLGKPPGRHAGPRTTYVGSLWGYWIHPEGWVLPNGNIHKGWISDAGAVCVEFGKDGRVSFALWSPVFVPPTPESRWESLCRMARQLSGRFGPLLVESAVLVAFAAGVVALWRRARSVFRSEPRDGRRRPRRFAAWFVLSAFAVFSVLPIWTAYYIGDWETTGLQASFWTMLASVPGALQRVDAELLLIEFYGHQLLQLGVLLAVSVGVGRWLGGRPRNVA